MKSRLKMSSISKRFGATQALEDVSFAVGPGEVRTLIGENGAGKSTLMKILSGAYRADRGQIELDGEPFAPRNPTHARARGISMIYQELTLAPDLSVEENILLGKEPRRLGWLRKGERRAQARAALERLNRGDLPLAAPAFALSIAEQQIVEIARALITQPRVLVMDEPTSSLTQIDVERLFEVIRRLKAEGVSIVYISHFLEECQQVCDRYTVLRDGKSVGEGDMARTDLGGIIHLMVGREMEEIYPRIDHRLGEPVLEVRCLAGHPKPRNVSFTLRRGEILGIAGLVGAGRTEMLRVLFGLDPMKTGNVRLKTGPSNHRTPRERLREGIGLLSENRKEEGLLLDRSLADNITLTRLDALGRFGFIRGGEQHQTARRWMQRLSVKAADSSQSAGELSGGNQQKIALGRLLHHDAAILLLDEPTRGIDVGSKAEIYRLIGELAAQGKAIIFVSSYLPELLGVCDTIGVMCRGELREIRPANEWTEHTILRAAIGQD